jgi:protein CpxP
MEMNNNAGRRSRTRKEALMVKTIRNLTLGALALGLLAGGTALAQGPGGPGGPNGPGGRGPRGMPGIELRGLDLTEAQREQIRALAEQYRESGGPVREQLAQAREAQRDALAVVPLNEGLVRSTTQALAEAAAQAAIVQARLRADVLALLTPDQRQALEERQTARAERLEERRERVEDRVRERREQRPDREQDAR